MGGSGDKDGESYEQIAKAVRGWRKKLSKSESTLHFIRFGGESSRSIKARAKGLARF